MKKPWGNHFVLGKLRGVKVKILVINSFNRLSQQRHNFRSEFWIVLYGRGLFEVDRMLYVGKKFSKFKIRQGSIHRISNMNIRKLVILEFQFGKVLDENDIERYHDEYGRSGGNV